MVIGFQKFFTFVKSCLVSWPFQSDTGEPEVCRGSNRSRRSRICSLFCQRRSQHSPVHNPRACPLPPHALQQDPHALGSSVCNGPKPGVRANILCMALTKWEHLEMKIAVNALTHPRHILSVCAWSQTLASPNRSDVTALLHHRDRRHGQLQVSGAADWESAGNLCRHQGIMHQMKCQPGDQAIRSLHVPNAV